MNGGMMNDYWKRVQITNTKFCLIRYDKHITKYLKINEKCNFFKIQEYF